MVQLNNFELTIVRATDGAPFPTKNEGENVYVEVPDQTQYKIRVKCLRQQKGDATIHVDGESVGTFRLHPYQTVTLERPAGVNKCFMFCHEDKLKSDKDLVGKEKNGLIAVDFVAETYKPALFGASLGSLRYGGYDGMQPMSLGGSAPATRGFSFGGGSAMPCLTSMACSSTTSHASGLTMLGESTTQSFQKVGELSDIDEKSRTRIAVRLIGPAKKEPLTPLQKEKGLDTNDEYHKMSDPPRIN